MGEGFFVGRDGEYLFFDDEGNPAGKIKGCILTLSKRPDGLYAMIDTGENVLTVRLASA